MKELSLTNGMIALVDDEDFDGLSGFNWYGHVFRNKHSSKIYATRHRLLSEPFGTKMIKMHREILKAPSNIMIDHKNGDGLDNRKENLRVCTPGQNKMNANKHAKYAGKRTGSKYKGVHFSSKGGSSGRKFSVWVARIQIEGVRIFLGCFEHEVDAGLAYNEAAVKYFGEFAKLNKISDG